jgi:hypothetical protein
MRDGDVDVIARKLRDIVHTGGMIEAAQVQLIGLDEVEAAAGPNWPRLKDRVRSGSVHLIQSHLAANDVVIPAGNGFLILFASGAAEPTRELCDQIRTALIGFYLGEEGLERLHPEVRQQAIAAQNVSALLDTAAMKPPKRKLDPALPAGAEVEFVPLWALREGRIAAEIGWPLLPGREGRHVGYDPDFLLGAGHHPESYLNLDLRILERAIAVHADGASRRPVGIQVHAMTMQHRRARESYLSWLSEMREDLPRTAFISIAEIERGTPMMSIMQWVGLLRRHIDHIVLDFHYADHALGGVRETGAWAISTHLPVQASAQKAQYRGPLLDQLKFWTHAIRARGMRLIVYGFQDTSFAAEAARIGVDLGAGRCLETLAPARSAAHADDLDHHAA